eukprot:4197590-Amphidinium_carterae.1
MMSAPRSTFFVSTSCTARYSPARARKKKPKVSAAHSTALFVCSPGPSTSQVSRRSRNHTSMAVVTPSFLAGAGAALFILSSKDQILAFLANGSGAPALR